MIDWVKRVSEKEIERVQCCWRGMSIRLNYSWYMNIHESTLLHHLFNVEQFETFTFLFYHGLFIRWQSTSRRSSVYTSTYIRVFEFKSIWSFLSLIITTSKSKYNPETLFFTFTIDTSNYISLCNYLKIRIVLENCTIIFQFSQMFNQNLFILFFSLVSHLNAFLRKSRIKSQSIPRNDCSVPLYLTAVRRFRL